MSMADEIKQRVKMPDIFERYGFETNRGGFISCPFHSERTASLSAYHNGERWKCFGCGAGGDVISFVMQLYGLTFYQAVRQIDRDFSLGILNQHVSYSQLRQSETARKAREKEQAQLESLKEAYRTCNVLIRELAPHNMEEIPDERFTEALKDRDYYAYLLSERGR